MKTSEIREFSTDELLTRRRDLKEEMLLLRFQHASNQLENTARIYTARRTLARIETILSERRRLAAAP
ncbi:MAG TPA: 50S ribosomal protein L29 [Verrucomicrobiales bacterium]|nr:50S ribosomal protein L29 [Verrucomicrobiales bacterium]